MLSHLELEGNRFRQGWGAASFSGPPGMDVKKRRKPATHGDGVGTARGPQVPRLPTSALIELLVQRASLLSNREQSLAG